MLYDELLAKRLELETALQDALNVKSHMQQMVDDAIDRIDALSVEKLEREFKLFGLDIERK